MLIVRDKEIPESLEELVAPSHTALIIVDAQNDCCSPGGSMQLAGGDISMYPAVIGRVRAVIAAARKVGVRIIYIQNTNLPGGVSESPAQIRLTMRLNQSYSGVSQQSMEYTVAGSWGHCIIDELVPEQGDVVVQKYRSSGFIGTNLDLILRSNLIRTVVVAGCTTEGCVDSTVRDAGFFDYFVVVPSDCVASDNRELHEAALLIMRTYRADMTTSEDLLRTWEAAVISKGSPGAQVTSR